VVDSDSDTSVICLQSPPRSRSRAVVYDIESDDSGDERRRPRKRSTARRSASRSTVEIKRYGTKQEYRAR
jgi:hypothetical protein